MSLWKTNKAAPETSNPSSSTRKTVSDTFKGLMRRGQKKGTSTLQCIAKAPQLQRNTPLGENASISGPSQAPGTARAVKPSNPREIPGERLTLAQRRGAGALTINTTIDTLSTVSSRTAKKSQGRPEKHGIAGLALKQTAKRPGEKTKLGSPETPTSEEDRLLQDALNDYRIWHERYLAAPAA
jgi:hypothetical protein